MHVKIKEDQIIKNKNERVKIEIHSQNNHQNTTNNTIKLKLLVSEIFIYFSLSSHNSFHSQNISNTTPKQICQFIPSRPLA